MDLLNIWQNGMFGVIVGDALGCPVEFDEREIRDINTAASIAGGLTGLYNLTDGIPHEWLNGIQRKVWIEELYERVDETFE